MGVMFQERPDGPSPGEVAFFRSGWTSRKLSSRRAAACEGPFRRTAVQSTAQDEPANANDGQGDGSLAQQEGRPNLSHACESMTTAFWSFSGFGGGGESAGRPCGEQGQPVMRCAVPQPVGNHPCPAGLVTGGNGE